MSTDTCGTVHYVSSRGLFETPTKYIFDGGFSMEPHFDFNEKITSLTTEPSYET